MTDVGQRPRAEAGPRTRRERRALEAAGHPAAGRRGPARRRPSPPSRAVRWALAVGVAVVLVLLGVGVSRAAWLTTHPEPEQPDRVDALLVLYSRPQVYEAALEAIDRGVADRVFVSAHLGPDGFQTLCGPPGVRDPRADGAVVECFAPDPVTTQGEVMHAADRMRELGLEHLGVLTFPQHVERARILAERCLPPEEGTVSLLMFTPRQTSPVWELRQDVYGTLAFGKVWATPDCADELPAAVQWPLDVYKRLKGLSTVPDHQSDAAVAP